MTSSVLKYSAVFKLQIRSTFKNAHFGYQHPYLYPVSIS